VGEKNLDSRPAIPQPTIARLAIYLRDLRAAVKEGVRTLSSAEIERRTGISSGQVRKDLSYFGEFGKPGRGYEVATLVEHLSSIMGLDREQPVLIVGAGNLGSALAGYPGFPQSGVQVVAIYDNNYSKIGRKIWDLEILDVQRLPELNREMKARIGVIATPAAAAREVADLMVEAGVKVILNFAPTRVAVPEGIVGRNVDMTQELQILCYYLLGESTESGEQE